MADIHIRKDGRVGHITLNRPKALNALTYPMCMEIEQALDAWAVDDEVAMVVIDATGEKAFCAGGDIQEMYDSGTAGNFDYGRRFWADEYRMNAKVANFPKPYAAFMQGFTMGGGVGVSCHGSHRIVGDSSQIAMPECGIGLVPDVGGSLLLAQAPGRLGAYLGTTSTRMKAGDAIYAGFADYYIPEGKWGDLTNKLIATGDWTEVDKFAGTPPESGLKAIQSQIDSAFYGASLRDVVNVLRNTKTEFAENTLKTLARNSPLSMAVSVEMTHRLLGLEDIKRALELEYRFTYRSMEHGDFLEGIRAAIIDKDRNPNWKHDDMRDVTTEEVAAMLLPLAENALRLKE